MPRVSHVASICRWLPTAGNESAGVFVLRRLQAMAAHADLTVIQPVPYFPVLRSFPEWAKQGTRRQGELPVVASRMFYVPGILKSLDAFWLYRAIVGTLASLQAVRPIDVIDAHFGYPDGVGSYLAGRRLGIPYFITFRGLEVDYVNDWLIGRQIREAVRHAAGCICVSSSLQELALEYGAEPDKIHVVHNAVNKSVFKPGDRSRARSQLELPPDMPLVISVGHLLAVKGHDILLQAFAEVRGRLPGARLVIIGGSAHEPKYPGRLKALAKQAGLQDSVVFLGSVPPADVATWLRAADVFALATRREGCCNAVLESLATGTPVVTTPVGENPYFVRNGQNGFIVPNEDSSAMAEALVNALTVKKWDSHSISATAAVGDWEQVADRIFRIFEDRRNDSRPPVHRQHEPNGMP